MIIKDLTQMEHYTTLLEPSLISILSSTRMHNETYLSHLLHPNADCAALLHPKAILSSEIFMKSDGPQSFQISQHIALSLLSKDKYGLFFKRGSPGSHAVYLEIFILKPQH